MIFGKEQEIDNFLKSEEGQIRLAEEYRLQQILIPLKKTASSEEVKNAYKKINEVIKKYSLVQFLYK